MRTVVETDDHIGIVAELKLDALFWSEMKLSRGAIWLKGDAPVSQRAVAGVLPDQRIGLKSTRVGDDGPLLATHLVQPAQRGYGGTTWTLHCSRSALSTERTTPSVAAGKKVGKDSRPCGNCKLLCSEFILLHPT